MRFRPAAFNRLLGTAGTGLGQRVAWEVASLCPCRNRFEGAADRACPNCRGKGTVWGAAQPASVGVSSMKVAREWAAFGEWQSGDVVLSLPEASPAWQAGESDRFTMLDSTVPFQRIQERGDPNEAWGPGIVQVQRVWWRHPTTKLPVEGSTDVTVDAAGLPSWPRGGGPPDATPYSVDARRHPTYYVLKDLPQDRAHHGGMRLPRRVAARLFDLWGRG